MRLIQFYYFATRLLRSVMPEEERQLLEDLERIGTDEALEEIRNERLRRKGGSK